MRPRLTAYQTLGGARNPGGERCETEEEAEHEVTYDLDEEILDWSPAGAEQALVPHHHDSKDGITDGGRLVLGVESRRAATNLGERFDTAEFGGKITDEEVSKVGLQSGRQLATPHLDDSD